MILRSSSMRRASSSGGRLGNTRSSFDSILRLAPTRPAPPPPSSAALELAPAAASSSSVISTELAAPLPSDATTASSSSRSSSSIVSSLIARCCSLNMPVPTGMGIPMIMHSLTPSTVSVLPCSAASNRWSVVFSNDASMRTLSFIFAMPNRVMPSTSPLYVITSARSME